MLEVKKLSGKSEGKKKKGGISLLIETKKKKKKKKKKKTFPLFPGSANAPLAGSRSRP